MSVLEMGMDHQFGSLCQFVQCPNNMFNTSEPYPPRGHASLPLLLQALSLHPMKSIF